jgi:hypothetical protein
MERSLPRRQSLWPRGQEVHFGNTLVATKGNRIILGISFFWGLAQGEVICHLAHRSLGSNKFAQSRRRLKCSTL